MNPYHKIPTVYRRDPDNRYRTLLHGEFSRPELGYLANNSWEFTEKVDGTNIRVIYESDRQFVKFAGREEKSNIPAPLWASLVELFPERKFIKQEYKTMTLYGEGFGKGIQKVGNQYRNEPTFVLFDVKIGDYWLARRDMVDVAERLGIEFVPLMGYGTLKDGIRIAANGFLSGLAEEMLRAEGLVMRPTTQLFDRTGKRIICKIKYKDFER